jgi:hypothetical protein
LVFKPSRYLHARAETKLVPDLLDVVLRSALGDEEPFGDLSVAQARGDQGRHLLLAPAQSNRCHVKTRLAG